MNHIQATGRAAKAKTNRIRMLNDNLRQSFLGGEFLISKGVHALGHAREMEIIKAVMAFDNFNSANDPDGEHNWAALTAAGHRINFKINCFDPTGQFQSADPSRIDSTRRVLIIYLASEH